MIIFTYCTNILKMFITHTVYRFCVVDTINAKKSTQSATIGILFYLTV